MDKRKLYITDHLGNHLDEPTTQFILSLATKVSLTLIELDEVFLDDKVEYEYYATRQAQLDKSIKLSTESGQIKLYENIYLPALNVVKHSTAIQFDNIAIDGFNLEIDTAMEKLRTLVSGQFHPCNPSDMEKIDGFPDSTPDIKEIRELCTLVRDVDAKRPYVPPEGFNLKSIPIPIWTPDKLKMQEEVLSEGYFTGQVGQRFYVSPVDPIQAKLAMNRAKIAILPAYKEIIDNKLKSAYINQYYNEVMYLERQ